MTNEHLTTAPMTTTDRRTFGVLTLGAVVALSVAACGSFSDAAHLKAWDYDTATDDGAATVLADWVPQNAADIHLIQRTTGDERIVTMTADLADVRGTCTPVSADNPLVPHPQGDHADPADYRTAATITADWWTAGQEQNATLICGKWWVGQDGDQLWGFTPEQHAVRIEKQTA